MDRLKRALAPISDKAWEQIDSEAKRTLGAELTARRFVDLDGPHGDELAAVSVGSVQEAPGAPVPGVVGVLRNAQSLVELRADFELSLAELDAIDRGARDPNLDPLRQATRNIARCEDATVFHGYAGAGIRGMLDASAHEKLSIPTDYGKYPELVARGINLLEDASIEGPYALALGPRCWLGLQQAAGPGGYPVLFRVSRMLDGQIVRAPAIDGAALMSVRGGDFMLTVGRDFSIGYATHSTTAVHLYVIESMTFRALTHEAAVSLVYT